VVAAGATCRDPCGPTVPIPAMLTVPALAVFHVSFVNWPFWIVLGLAENVAVGARVGVVVASVDCCCTNDLGTPPQPVSKIKGKRNLSLTCPPQYFSAFLPPSPAVLLLTGLEGAHSRRSSRLTQIELCSNYRPRMRLCIAQERWKPAWPEESYKSRVAIRTSLERTATLKKLRARSPSALRNSC